MSYRTFKRLLGETSLERKCRFLFGGGLMLLITGSFYLYAHQNAELVDDQSRMAARLLITPAMLANHSQYLSTSGDVESDQAADDLTEAGKARRAVLDAMGKSVRPEGVPDYAWSLNRIDLDATDATSLPFDGTSYDALRQLQSGEEEVILTDESNQEYHYFRSLKADQSCLQCHNDRARFPDQKEPIQVGELMGMAHIGFPLEETKRALAWNNAILLTTALVTAFLAMLSAWAIVRYVIVKPVLHLKDVSDEISKGNLDLRADIRTGDEFEELSHAFNRMLRHLVTVQDELREVNTDLDVKVDELAQLNLQLFEMNKLKDEFLATMTHELRTPLNSILGFSDLLNQAANIDDRQKRYLQNIEQSGRSLMALINDLLDVAKIESGKMDLHLSDLHLPALINQQVGLLQHMADQKNIELSWDVDDDLPPLWQDNRKLEQVMNNLLSNALKFTPEGGRVSVIGKFQRPDRVRIEVEDTGVGIRLEDQDTIFEKFRQGKSSPDQEGSLTREFGGTGLGLSIVKELTRLMGGSVDLESEFGKGSTFIVDIPIDCPGTLEGGPAEVNGLGPR